MTLTVIVSRHLITMLCLIYHQCHCYYYQSLFNAMNSQSILCASWSCYSNRRQTSFGRESLREILARYFYHFPWLLWVFSKILWVFLWFGICCLITLMKDDTGVAAVWVWWSVPLCAVDSMALVILATWSSSLCSIWAINNKAAACQCQWQKYTSVQSEHIDLC